MASHTHLQAMIFAGLIFAPLLLIKFGPQGPLSLRFSLLSNTKRGRLLGLLALAAVLPAARAAGPHAGEAVSCKPDVLREISEICYCGDVECGVGQYCSGEPLACHAAGKPSETTLSVEDFIAIMSAAEDSRGRRLAAPQGKYVRKTGCACQLRLPLAHARRL